MKQEYPEMKAALEYLLSKLNADLEMRAEFKARYPDVDLEAIYEIYEKIS